MDAKEVIASTRVEIDDTRFCNVTVSCDREQRYRETVTCGQKKSSKFTLKKGLDEESSSNTEMEFGINFAPLEAPKCGSQTITIYQYIIKVHVEPYKTERRFFQKKIKPGKPSDYVIREEVPLSMIE